MRKFNKISFKNYKAFEDFTIDCGNFQWTVLLGNNNTGKTSLLKAIATLHTREILDKKGQKVCYQKKYKDFTDSLDANDKEKAKAAYETLIQILHPESSSHRILEMQLELLLEDD